MNKEQYKKLLRLRRSQEVMLFELIHYYGKLKVSPADIVETMGIPTKRACYILEKWTSKGYYDYGVNVLFGWPETDELPNQGGVK